MHRALSHLGVVWLRCPLARALPAPRAARGAAGCPVWYKTRAVYDEAAPDPVREFAEQAVAYVRAALHLELAYDSDTLPLIDHYLRNVPDAQKATVAL